MQPNEIDRQRFLEMLEMHQGILHRICLAYAAQPADRQDLFQDIVLQLWRSFTSFRGRSSLTTWIYRVALNTALLRWRRVSRRPELTSLDAAPVPALPAAPAPPNDHVAVLRSCIRDLPSLDRAIVLLHLDEHSYDQIAEITGLTRANVSVRLVRLKERLRRMLEARGLGREAVT